MDELIICVAPYPGEKQTEKFSRKMDVAEEVILSCSAGASIAHLHVRDEKGLQTKSVKWFQKDLTKIRSSCPIIVEGSTGGAPEHTLAERCLSFTVPGIEMGSLNLGSINMFGDIYRNSISDIRFYSQELKQRGLRPFQCIFDLSMFHNVMRLEEEKLLVPPHVYNFVFDIPDTLPFSIKALEIFISYLRDGDQWFLTRHHAKGWKDLLPALERGGHVRVGYEDGPFLSSGDRADSNAQLVEEIVRAADVVGRKVVGADRAREILGINKQ